MGDLPSGGLTTGEVPVVLMLLLTKMLRPAICPLSRLGPPR